ncbi:hypothetical protein [Sulfitobacter delicatus]|uniref:Uncharacterized protein n=1 Tax=Sulfitobacter delicatus TaxID=218672 RepID=A0A1G7XI85_9RHOB|nr:hypothetical protein [Sulfitobacter delicatus]SDG83827.1 hypothetical protein SAMN04489759_112121 [Sulfitobacter delicatus]
MNYETHSILHSSPDELGGWSGCISENWILSLVTDVHGRVRDARV